MFLSTVKIKSRLKKLKIYSKAFGTDLQLWDQHMLCRCPPLSELCRCSDLHAKSEHSLFSSLRCHHYAEQRNKSVTRRKRRNEKLATELYFNHSLTILVLWQMTTFVRGWRLRLRDKVRSWMGHIQTITLPWHVRSVPTQNQSRWPWSLLPR